MNRLVALYYVYLFFLTFAKVENNILFRFVLNKI